MTRTILFTVFFSVMAAQSVHAADSPKVHKKVQQALDWELPQNKCVFPKAPGKRKQVTDDMGSTHTEWDVDTYTLKRYQRKENRWKKCVERYKTSLGKEFETLKASAQYGLTQPQAETILAKMKLIQQVMMSESGQLENATAQNN
ncbi:MAG: hypothetical protein ACFHXK_06055 [bacterium]